MCFSNAYYLVGFRQSTQIIKVYTVTTTCDFSVRKKKLLEADRIRHLKNTDKNLSVTCSLRVFLHSYKPTINPRPLCYITALFALESLVCPSVSAFPDYNQTQ